MGVRKVNKEAPAKTVLPVSLDQRVNLVSGDDLALMVNVELKAKRETKVSQDLPAHLAILETMVNQDQEVSLACPANLASLAHQRKSTWSISDKPCSRSSTSSNPAENLPTLSLRE